MIARRSLLAAPLLLIPAESRAADPQPGRQPPRLPTPRQVVLRPRGQRVTLRAGIAETDRMLRLTFEGPGAPAEPFAFPSWYGFARVFAVRTLRGRDAVFVAFEGSTGTGAYQELQAVIAEDDDGGARILALETLHYRLDGPCGEGARLAVTATPIVAGGGLRLDQVWRQQDGECPPRRGGPARRRLAWATTLDWSGRGPMQPPRPLAGAPAPRRRVEEVRTRTMAWLAAEPRRSVTHDDLDALGVYDVIAEG